MRRLASHLVVVIGAILVSSALAQTRDPVEAMKSFADFQSVNLDRLLSGEILVERGGLMDFPSGICGQTCFAVPLSAEETAKRLQVWDPTPHADLQVYAFHELPVPCGPADFQKLDFRSSSYSIRWLLEKSAATTGSKSDLNVSRDEAAALAACLQRRTDPPLATRCWAALLGNRAARFQQDGVDGALPYEVGPGGHISPIHLLSNMISEQTPIAHEFFPLLKKIGLIGRPAPPLLTPFYYWSFFDADHHGTISLGAVYLLAQDGRYLVADVEYYVSDQYFTSATLCEIWPIQAGGKPAALVWRGDYFSAPVLAFTKGTERIAYGALMMQDIKRETHDFQTDQGMK